jgi:fucose permease
MKIILILILVGFIFVLWGVANAMNKPVLNRIHNYYEDDTEGRHIANMIIGIMLVLAFLLGLLVA